VLEHKTLGANFISQLIKTVNLYSHLVMVVLILGVVALMVLPVPPAALDLLIAFNISVSVLMLMLAIYIPGSLGMSTFPSLIVLTTVLRLSLNIASTKQILLHAHAGNIIETFGRLVMGGQVVVGLVVFSIIAIVQFIVISKGAERVAEVGARFTLDAMPGKQMSIEADLRGGLIDKFEARRRRSLLEQESHMHGSMDGAMKFVKGDAIAAIIIAIVNIVAGIYIGVVIMNMPIADAMGRFTLLSVGDGMVSQIPSLLTSIAAGVLTTRLAGDEGRPKNLATQIGRQITAQPMALMAASGILFVLVFVPGFPKLPFLVLSTIFASVGWRSLKRFKSAVSFEKAGTALVSVQQVENEPDVEGIEDESVIVAPLLLRIAVNVRNQMSPVVLQAALENEKHKLQLEIGLSFPKLQVRFDEALEHNTYAIDVQEIPSPVVRLGESTDSEQINYLEAELARSVADVVRNRPDAFVGTQEINALVKRVQVRLPDLSEEVLRAMPMQRVAEVLRRLALEGVSLRYLREIYESLLTWASREKDTALLCECVRADLGRFICHRFIDSDRCLKVITLDPAAESVVRDGIKHGVNGAYIAILPNTQLELIETAVKVSSALPEGLPSVLLVTQETRRFIRRILVARLPQLHVLSYAELPSDVQINSIGLIMLPTSLPQLPTIQ
jgi:type III secretion protein V